LISHYFFKTNMDRYPSISGTGVALVTPFTPAGDIDFSAYERLIEFVIQQGVEYVVTLGTTGETPTLSKDEKKELIHRTYDIVQQRIPVIVGVGGNDTRALIQDLESLPLEGAAAILSASPYYNKPSQEGIFLHYAAAAAASPKPIILYNVPGRTGRNMLADTTLRLAEIPNIMGMKEASGDMAQCATILKYKPAHFQLVSGDDALAMAQIASGMTGVISVIANAFPQGFSTMIRHAMAGDLVTAKSYNDLYLEVYDMLFAENNPAGVKAFLAARGQIGNHLRLPMTPVSKSLQEKITGWCVAHPENQ
jgi:4-hydroxy-tetrahydrodipicolinate synthase